MQDLNEMAIFAIVVNTGSFTKAADKLKLPKSTVSRKVSQLEKRVGVRLINRTTRNLKPTETGKLYYSQCLKMLEQAEEADRIVTNMQSEPSGLLRISTPLSFGTPFFIKVIKRFLEKYPKVNIEIVADNKQVDLLEHEVDIAFRIGPLSDSSLIARNIGTARLSLCATPEYLAQYGEPKTIQELEQHTCISHPASPWVFQNSTGNIEFQPSSRMIANDMEMIRKMVKQGFGIGAVPQILISDDLNDKSLIPVLPEFPFLDRTFYLVYPSRREPPSKVVAFTDFIFSNCQPIAPWEISAIQNISTADSPLLLNKSAANQIESLQTN